MSTSPPTHADVVVIGGGVIGLSTAYTLARSGVGKVVLLDQGPFGSGSTCKAAGGVRAQFSDETHIVMGHYGLDVFERFHQLFDQLFDQEIDQEIDLRQNGYLFLRSATRRRRRLRAERGPAAVARRRQPHDRHRGGQAPGPDHQRRAPIVSTEGVLAAA